MNVGVDGASVRLRRSTPNLDSTDVSAQGETSKSLAKKQCNDDAKGATNEHTAGEVDYDSSELTPRDILPAAGAVAALSICAALFGLVDLAEDVLIASIRTFVQLTCLATILSPFFRSTSAVLVLSYAFLFMIPLAAYEATARSDLTQPGAYMASLLGLMCGVSPNLAVALFAVVRPKPWYSPRHAIPLAGMLVNNALPGAALALGHLLRELQSGSSGAMRVETMLAFGASPWEASRPALANAVRLALVPTLNSMNVIGLVSIPGMMTGQVLGGASPLRAARYQIMIMFLIAACAGLTAAVTGALSVRDSFDCRGVLRGESIVPNVAPRVSQLFQRSGDIFDLGWGQPKGSKILAATNRLVELRKEETPSQAGSHKAEFSPILDVDVRGMFAGGERDLRAKLLLPPNEVAVVLGASGVGKSTLLRAIAEMSNFAGRETAASSIKLWGRERRKYSATHWRRKVLYVPQGGAKSLPGTPRRLLEDVRGLHVRRGEPDATLDEAAVMKHLLAWGMKDPLAALDRPWADLSGGEAQRVLLAIAVSSRPDVLLLDEPTSALDDESKRRVEATLSQLGCAVVFVTHDEEQAARVGNSRWRLVEVQG